MPFCVRGGTALGEGVGEVLSPAPAPPDHRLLVVKPRRGADTAEVYRAYDAGSGGGNATERVLRALRSGDLAGLAGAVGNDLAPVTKAMIPEVAELEGRLLEAGAMGASMTGTGTAVYGLFRDEDEAARAANGWMRPSRRLRPGPPRVGVGLAPGCGSRCRWRAGSWTRTGSFWRGAARGALPGGGLEAGESSEECVARELREEIGLTVEAGALLDAWV